MIHTSLGGLTVLALVLGHAPVPQQAQSPTGQPPGIFLVTQVTRDAMELQGPGGRLYRPELRDLEIFTAGGRKLTKDDLLKRLKAGSVVVVAADEHKVNPGYLRVLREDTLVLLGVVVLVARPDNPGRGWTLDLNKMWPAEGPVSGRALGAEFKAEKIELLNTGLALRGGKDYIHIFLHLKPGEAIEGKTFEWEADGPPGASRPHIHLHIHSPTPGGGAAAYVKGYAMRLEFGKGKDGKVPAKIYLCLPDQRKSFLAGTFTLDLK